MSNYILTSLSEIAGKVTMENAMYMSWNDPYELHAYEKKYKDHIASLPRFQVIGLFPNKKVGEILVEGVDFIRELQKRRIDGTNKKWWKVEDTEPRHLDFEYRTVAIPITPTEEKNNFKIECPYTDDFPVKENTEEKIVIITSVLSKEYALTKEDADKIYPELQSAISEQMNISLSFDGIENCSNVFLRHTIGAAYLNYGVEVDKFIKITGIHPDDILLPLQIKKFKERALANHITDEGERIEETQDKVRQCIIYDSLNEFADIGDKMTIHRKDFNKAAKLISLAIKDSFNR